MAEIQKIHCTPMCCVTKPMIKGPPGVPMVIINVHQPIFCARSSLSHNSVTMPLPIAIGGQMNQAPITRIAICAPYEVHFAPAILQIMAMKMERMRM